MKLAFRLLLFGTLFLGCSLIFNTMTEKERKDFEIQCFSQDTVYNLFVAFSRFENNAFDSALVKEFNKELLLDSFKLFVKSGSVDLRFARIPKKLNINYSYQFIVPKQKPFVLAEMKIVPMPIFSGFKEGYRCEMANFTIDSIKFQREPYPVFIKR